MLYYRRIPERKDGLMIINLKSKKVKRCLGLILAVVSIAGSGLTASAANTSNSANTTSTVKPVALCLQNAKLSSGKTYISNIQTSKANARYNVWRKSDQLMSIQSSNSKVAYIGKEGYNRYIKTGDGGVEGNAVVTVKYKSGITDKINVSFKSISSSTVMPAGQTKNLSYTGGKSPVRSVKVLSGSENGTAIKNNKMFQVTTKKKGQMSVKVIYDNDLVEQRKITVTEAVDPVRCEQRYTHNQFMNMGVIYFNNKRFTYYSQSVLPGYGLNIPGRHVQDGFVSDKDGYIVLASPNLTSYPRYSTIDTPFGRKGKFYDFCPGGSFDVYVK